MWRPGEDESLIHNEELRFFQKSRQPQKLFLPLFYRFISAPCVINTTMGPRESNGAHRSLQKKKKGEDEEEFTVQAAFLKKKERKNRSNDETFL